MTTCWLCKGRKTIVIVGALKQPVECPKCRGTGQLPVVTSLATKQDSMSRTKIDWVKNQDGTTKGYTINPVKGLCPMACPYCYARRMYERFGWNPEIRYDASWWEKIEHIKKPSCIFIGSTIELFGDWVKWAWLKYILQKCEYYPQHTFIFLTKKPENLARWSPFPPNVWVGASATDPNSYWDAWHGLKNVDASVKFISFEPLLNGIAQPQIGFMRAGISWLIIGQQTPASKKTEPKIEWIQEIVEAADKADIPVFLKNNLAPLLYHRERHDLPTLPEWASDKVAKARGATLMRQEFPILGKKNIMVEVSGDR